MKKRPEKRLSVACPSAPSDCTLYSFSCRGNDLPKNDNWHRSVRDQLPTRQRWLSKAKPRSLLQTTNSYIFRRLHLTKCAPVAQLDRAFGYEPKGRRFESFRAHHLKIEPGTLDSRNGEISHKKLISARVASNWPPTSTRRKTLSSDGVQLAVVETGAPGGTRTPDPLVRSQMLYPAELQAQKTGKYWNILKITNKWNSGN
jgi:hypothetical protein